MNNKNPKKVLPYDSNHILSAFHTIFTGIIRRKARSIAEYSYKRPECRWGKGVNHP